MSTLQSYEKFTKVRTARHQYFLLPTYNKYFDGGTQIHVRVINTVHDEPIARVQVSKIFFVSVSLSIYIFMQDAPNRDNKQLLFTII